MPSVAEREREAEMASDAARIADLAKDDSPRVRSAAALNPHGSDDTVAALLHDPNEIVRVQAGRNLANRPELHPLAAASSDRWVRAALAQTFQDDDDRWLPFPIQQRLASDDLAEARFPIAKTTPFMSIFSGLIKHADPLTRGWCAANPRITRDQMALLVGDSDRRTRSMAVALGLRYPTDEQLIRLADDRSVQVQWEVVSRVDAPRAAVEKVAGHADETNKQHAQILLDGGWLTAPDAQEVTRADRRRADRGLEFIPDP